MASNYTTWGKIPYGSDFNTDYLTDARYDDCYNCYVTFTFNATGIALLNTKIGTSNFFEIIMVNPRTMNGFEMTTMYLEAETESNANSLYWPELSITY